MLHSDNLISQTDFIFNFFDELAYVSYSSGIISIVEHARAERTREPRMSIGCGGFSSAAIGAKIVASLPEKLQIPVAVPQKSVGNNYTIDR